MLPAGKRRIDRLAFNKGPHAGLHLRRWIKWYETFGNNWGSGQFLVTAQYDEKQALRTRELGITTVDFRARGGGDFRQPGFGSPGTVLPLGVFAGQPFTTLTGPNGEPVFSTSLPPGDGRNLQLDQLGLNQVNYTDAVATDIAPHEHNTSIYGTVEQDLGAVTLFADAAYSDRVSRLRTVNAFTYIYVPQSNAFSPFHEDVLVGYEFADFGPIAYVVDNTGWFADLGVRGVFGPKEWTWDPYRGKIEDGDIYGRGACDQRAGMASMVYAGKLIKELELGGDEPLEWHTARVERRRRAVRRHHVRSRHRPARRRHAQHPRGLPARGP